MRLRRVGIGYGYVMLLLLGLSSLVSAETLSGDFLTIDYNSGGTWNNSTDLVGFSATLGDTAVEFTYAGTAYQAWGVAYEVGGEAKTFQANSAAGNTIVVESGTDDSTPGVPAYTWAYQTGDLEITKTEWFDERDVSVGVQFTIVNQTDTSIENLQLLYTFDPDQDAVAYGAYPTVNDVGDANDDGDDDWASARGPSSDITIGIGACDPNVQVLGFFSTWQTETLVDVPLLDSEGATADDAIALQYLADRSVPAFGELSFRFVVAVDVTGPEAADAYLALAADVCCDGDGDGTPGAACGGADCDDTTGELRPGAEDVPYDGIDQDCSGADNADLDADGEVGTEGGGTDCDDTDAGINRMAAEVWYDGIDQNCDANDDDQDLDGATLAYDCDDQDPTIQVDCPEPDTDEGPVTTSDGCGCAAEGRGAGLVGLGLVLAALGRRRRFPVDARGSKG